MTLWTCLLLAPPAHADGDCRDDVDPRDLYAFDEDDDLLAGPESVPVDGALVWEDWPEGDVLTPPREDLVLRQNGVPIEVHPEVRVEVGLFHALRILLPVAPLEPGVPLEVLVDELRQAEIPVVEGPAAPAPPFTVLEATIGSWEHSECDYNTRTVTLRVEPPPGGTPRYAVFYQPRDATETLAGAHWGRVGTSDFTIIQQLSYTQNDCYVGRWVGDAGDLGPPSEPVCGVPPGPLGDGGTPADDGGCAHGGALPASGLSFVAALLLRISRRRWPRPDAADILRATVAAPRVTHPRP